MYRKRIIENTAPFTWTNYCPHIILLKLLEINSKHFKEERKWVEKRIEKTCQTITILPRV